MFVAEAAVIAPTSIGVETLPGSLDGPVPQSVYTDDLFLQSLVFPSVTFANPGNFRAAQDLEVITGRTEVNVEWGDQDTGADGDPTPLASIGQPDGLKETTDPAIQDAGLLQVFNSLSLTEMTDGEGPDFSFKVLFQNGLTDDNPGAGDQVPELIFVERGLNDTFDVELILGGSFENPVLSDPLRIDSGDFWSSGLSVNTTEISDAQELGVGGFDLNDWGLSGGETVFGFLLTGVQGGPDLNGFFLSAEDPGRFVDPLEPPVSQVPLPASILLLLSALGVLGSLRSRT